MAGVGLLPVFREELRQALEEARSTVLAGLPEKISRRAADIGRVILAFESLPRAMDLLRGLLKDPDRVGINPFQAEESFPSSWRGPLPNGTVVVARRLSRARGRFDRTWVAEEGGLWLAMALYDDWLPEVRGWFPILFGLAVAAALRRLGAPVAVKWVNDVHLGGRKICGVLIEQAVAQGEPWSLVGLGVNVNNTPPRGVPALSLKEILGRPVEPTLVFGLVLAEITKFYGLLRSYEKSLQECRYEGKAPENPLYTAFLELSDTLGQRVLFGYNLEEGREAGVVKALLPSGALLLETARGEVTLTSGEILYL